MSWCENRRRHHCGTIIPCRPGAGKIEDKAIDIDKASDQCDEASPTKENTIVPVVSANATEKTASTKGQSGNPKDKINPLTKAWHFVKDPSHSGAVMAIFTVLIFVTNVFYVVFSGLQFHIMKQTLIDAEHAGDVSTDQIWRAIGNLNWQARSMDGSARAAQDAILLNRTQFRQDQRPYIALAPPGQTANFHIAQSGPYMGHFGGEIHIMNYGKSPAIEVSRYAVVVIGTREEIVREIKARANPSRSARIIGPNDRPSVLVYTRDKVLPQVVNGAMQGTTPTEIVIYGRIEYTDTFGSPKPIYLVEFCNGFSGQPTSDDIAPPCKDHNRIQ